MTTPDPAAAGPISVPKYKLAQLVAACAIFRTRSGLAEDDAQAEDKLLHGMGGKKRIHYPAVEEKRYEQDLPLAVVTGREGWALMQKAGGQQNYLPYPEGKNLYIIIADRDRYQADPEASLRDFENFLGLLAQQLAAQFGVDDKLSGNEIVLAEAPALPTQAQVAATGRPYWHAVLRIGYGL